MICSGEVVGAGGKCEGEERIEALEKERLVQSERFAELKASLRELNEELGKRSNELKSARAELKAFETLNANLREELKALEAAFDESQKSLAQAVAKDWDVTALRNQLEAAHMESNRLLGRYEAAKDIAMFAVSVAGGKP